MKKVYGLTRFENTYYYAMHGQASSALGKSQRTVTELLGTTVAERVAMGPLIVLLDEVETLAADRSKMSLLMRLT